MSYGTVQITSSSGVSYNLNNVKINRAVTDAVDLTVVGAPQRARYTHGQSALTAECQLATGSTAPPKFGDTFTATFDSNYGAEQFMFKPVAFEADNQPGNIRIVPVECVRVINTITTTGTAST
jgi:hypothetical protein